MTQLQTNRSGRQYGDQFTIVVLPSGALGDEVLKSALAWTKSGLLSSAVWVLPEDATFADDAAPEVRCHFAGRWGDAVTDLFNTMGQHRRDLVRVVCCQILDARSAVDMKQVAAAKRLLESVRYSVPAVVERENVGRYGTTVLGVNAITGTTGLSGVPRQVVQPGWDLTAISSPEDRRDPLRANTWVRAGDNLIAVALTTTAVVGGLFAGVQEGPFDAVPGDSSAMGAKTIVMRSTIRAVLGERVVQEVARKAVAAAPEHGGTAKAQPDKFTVAYDDSLIRDTADWLDEVDLSALMEQEVRPDSDDQGELITVRQGFVAFLRFYGQALAAGPVAVWSFVVNRAEKVATGALVGGTEQSGIQLRTSASAMPVDGSGRRVVSPEAKESFASNLLAAEAADIKTNERRLRDRDRDPVRLPSAELWQSLRQAAVGLLDGGEMPPGAPAPKEGSRRLVLASPALVAPMPTDTFTVVEAIARKIGITNDAQRTIAACAPTTAERVRASLAEAADTHSATADEAAEALKVASMLADAEEEPEGPAHKELARASTVSKAAKDEATKFEGERDRLEDWLSSRTTSLMWTVGQRVQVRLDNAQNLENHAARDAITPSGIDPDRPAQLRRRFLVWFTAILAVVLVTAFAQFRWASDVVTRLNEFNLTRELHEWQVWTVWGVILLVWLTWVVRNWYVGILRYLRTFTLAWNKRRAAMARFRASHGDRRRLEAAAKQAEDWADVIGWSTHTPWTSELQPLDDDFIAPDPKLLPESMRLAQPSLDDAGLAEATDIAMAAVTRQGWHHRAYERLVASSLRADGEGELSRVLGSIDSDAPGTGGARTQLRKALATGVPQTEVVGEVIEAAAIELRNEQMGVSRLSVEVADPQPDEPMQVEDSEFLGQALVPAAPLATETWSERARVSGAHAQVHTVAWVPEKARGWASPTVEVRPVEDANGRRDLVYTVVRVDLSEPVDLDDLRLFEVGAAQVAQVADDSIGDFI